MIIAFYTGRLGRASVKLDLISSLVGGSFNMVTSALGNMATSYFNNFQQYGFNKKMARYNAELSKELSKYNQQIQLENAESAKALHDRSLVDTPALTRKGLEMGGFNPILAVNSAAGSPFSTSINSPQGTSSVSFGSASNGSLLPKVGLVDTLKSLADIERTRADTKLTERRTQSEGWQVKTLSRSEAQGLGASILGQLGINLHESEQTTFLIAYNPITGELRNLGDTSHGLGAVEPSNAADVRVIPVDWKTDKSPRYKFNPEDWELKPEYRQ